MIRRVLLVTLLSAATGGPVLAQDSPLGRYVRIGLEANRRLALEEISVRQAEERWARSRAAYLPSVTLEARYSRAEGGRTFEVPVGELLNPVYSALNEITGTGRFPTIADRSFPLLRDREQETRIEVTQVLWSPALRAETRSLRHRTAAARAGEAAERRALVRDIRIAYYTYANALRRERILRAAFDLVEENERSSTELWRAALVTRDRVHRARAERLEVETQRSRAEADRRIAASHLNYLLGRTPSAEIEVDPRDLELPRGAGARWDLSASAEVPLERAADQAVVRRPELESLGHAVAAAEAGIDAVRARTRPSLALALSGGIQGSEYGFGSDHRFALVSLLLSWNLTNGGEEDAAEREANLERERLRIRREDATARIRLEVEQAIYGARAALATVRASTERAEEAESAFRLVRRRQDENMATALEFLDARAALTRAQLARSISETEALIRLAELEFALGDDGP